MEEIWKEIPGAPGYHASSLGRIKRIKETILGVKERVLTYVTNYSFNTPIAIISINNKLHRISAKRLVKSAFEDHPQRGIMDIIEIDGDRNNLKSENLKWATRAESMKHRNSHPFTGATFPERIMSPSGKAYHYKFNRVSRSTVDEIKRLYSTGRYSQLQLACIYGVSQQCVHLYIHDKRRAK